MSRPEDDDDDIFLADVLLEECKREYLLRNVSAKLFFS